MADVPQSVIEWALRAAGPGADDDLDGDHYVYLGESEDMEEQAMGETIGVSDRIEGRAADGERSPVVGFWASVQDAEGEPAEVRTDLRPEKALEVAGALILHALRAGELLE